MTPFKKEKTLQFFFQNRDKLVLILGITALLIGVVKSFAPPLDLNPKTEIVPARQTSKTASQAKDKIIIDLSGAVIRPGVYYLPTGSRVKDALVSGGGLAKNANRDWIGKNLNLARPLADGSKIYIPPKGEALGQSSPPGVSANRSGKINLNLATGQQLETLPGVGPATAKRIIEYRQRSGGFRAVEEIQSVSGIGPKMFARIKDKIAVY